jgi:two-component system LytT family response regulator
MKKYIESFFVKYKIKLPDIVIYESGETLLADSGRADMVFLDIEMKGIDGIATGRELKKRNEKVIIFVVTSYAEYLDDAMRFHVFRYLSKPLDTRRLFRNLKDAIQLYSTSDIDVPIETRQGCYTVSSSDIVCVEAHERKVTVHTVTRDYDSIHPIQYWLERLPANMFFQTHRSFLVNMRHVSAFDHTLVDLCGGKFKAYLTRRKYRQFKEVYLMYLESVR